MQGSFRELTIQALQVSFGLLIDPIVDFLALVTVLASLYYVLRQKFPKFKDAKFLLVIIYLLFTGAVTIELVSNLGVTTEVKVMLAPWQVMFLIQVGVFLSGLAYSVHTRPPELRFVDRLVASLRVRLWPHGIVIFFASAYTVFLMVYLFTNNPRIISLRNLSGANVLLPYYGEYFFILAAPIILVYFAYPVPLLFIASMKASRAQRTLMLTFPLSWLAVATGLIIFNGFLTIQGIDARALSYVTLTNTFLVIATTLKKVSLYEAFFEPPKQVLAPVNPFTGRLGSKGMETWGMVQLLEFDPLTNYENALKDFAVEAVSKANLVFVFTIKGSSVWRTLAEVPEVRFYLMTNKVSYPRLGDNEHEVLVPIDPDVMLNMLDKTLKSNQDAKIALVFDNLSNMIMTLGLDASYKFLKEANEMLTSLNVTALFLIIAGAHDEKMTTIMKSVFPRHLAFNVSGLTVTK